MTKEAYIIGQSTAYTIISGIQENDGNIIGVKFKPLGLAKITGINMALLAGGVINAEEIWGEEVKWLCEAMQEVGTVEKIIVVLEQFIKKQLRATQLHYRAECVEGAISLMQKHRGNISINKLQYLTNVERKTLERAFMNFHGITPKVYSQIIRFNTAVQLINKDFNLTEISHNLDYFDQSHFIKEFKKFSGYTPTTFKETIEIEHSKRTIPID